MAHLPLEASAVLDQRLGDNSLTAEEAINLASSFRTCPPEKQEENLDDASL